MNLDKNELMKWRVQSPEEVGFHKVIIPSKSACKEAQMFRLNLKAGDSYDLVSEELELHAVLILGKAKLSDNEILNQEMNKFDAFYIPGNNKVRITAIEECIFYIAGAVCEGYGEVLFRKFDISLPIGDIHQIHGEGSGQREVMFTLAPQDKASRLICGLTWSGDGSWTSWPPHQHEKYLEEIYCYFDMPKPKIGFHVSYTNSGDIDNMVVHTVYSGTMVQAPAGYHPTVASPNSKNAYLWVLASFNHDVRRYDLAELDPAYKDK